jgi:hypothetical protein
MHFGLKLAEVYILSLKYGGRTAEQDKGKQEKKIMELKKGRK